MQFVSPTFESFNEWVNMKSIGAAVKDLTHGSLYSKTV
jgi:hypothetical protein